MHVAFILAVLFQRSMSHVSACCHDASLSGVLSAGYEAASLLQLLHVEASKAFFAALTHTEKKRC